MGAFNAWHPHNELLQMSLLRKLTLVIRVSCIVHLVGIVVGIISYRHSVISNALGLWVIILLILGRG
ncbi:hypothetical protein D3C77_443820 [compost metagenome]